MRFYSPFYHWRTRELEKAEAFARMCFVPAPDFMGADADLSPAHAEALARITVRNAAPDLCSTDEGFVVMSVRLRGAINREGSVALPGADADGRMGWLVLGTSPRPFHSRAGTADGAIADAHRAQFKALQLETYFGGKSQMRATIDAAPWYEWCRLSDAQDSGLCVWGVERFLEKYRLRYLVRTIGGLPKFAISSGGGYARRALAHALMRKSLAREEEISRRAPSHR